MARKAKAQLAARATEVARVTTAKRWRFAPGAEAELASLPRPAIAGLTTLMERHLAGTTRAGPHFKHAEGDVWYLRYEHANNHFRLMMMRSGYTLVALSAFFKNQEKLPRQELKKALRRAKEWKQAEADTARSQ